MKKVVWAGVCLVIIVVILVMAGSAMSNNSSSQEQFSCDNPPPQPGMWERAADGTAIISPAYNKWQEKYGLCSQKKFNSLEGKL
jgi:hypothetical protein